jgi:ADP-ribose pyrophosphatase YjhB (NUDIX family)
MSRKNSHCSYCGVAFAEEQPWPRQCGGCGRVSYVNPTPVGVLLLPVDGGLLTIRRGIPPAVGKLALPGGYVDLNETWQQAAARELWEEAGIRIDAAEIEDFAARSSETGDGILMIIGVAKHRTSAELPPFRVTEETTDRVVIPGPIELAFPLHTEIAALYFARSKPGSLSTRESA